MNNLALVKSEMFGSVQCDFWKDEHDNPLMTIAQLAEVLGYSSKSGIENILMRNEYLKDSVFSSTHGLRVNGKTRRTRLFTEDGIYEVTFLAQNSAKAQEFRAWVRKVLKILRAGQNDAIKEIREIAKKKRVNFTDILSKHGVTKSYHFINITKGMKKQLDIGTLKPKTECDEFELMKIAISEDLAALSIISNNPDNYYGCKDLSLESAGKVGQLTTKQSISLLK